MKLRKYGETNARFEKLLSVSLVRQWLTIKWNYTMFLIFRKTSNHIFYFVISVFFLFRFGCDLGLLQ